MNKSIDDILDELDEIIDQSILDENPSGYFPALYRKVTQSVKDHITNDFFADGPRMERLDVVFASRYLDAYKDYLQSQPSTASWTLAFQSTRNKKLIVLQHLLLGMNAHINLDLGIAAADICKGQDIQELKEDFFRINEVLGALVDQVQKELRKIWPLMRIIDWLAGRFDENLADFSMGIARDGAWKVACDLAALNPKDRKVYILSMDQRVKEFGGGIVNSGWAIRVLVFLIRVGEKKNVSNNIKVLNEQVEKALMKTA